MLEGRRVALEESQGEPQSVEQTQEGEQSEETEPAP